MVTSLRLLLSRPGILPSVVLIQSSVILTVQFFILANHCLLLISRNTSGMVTLVLTISPDMHSIWLSTMDTTIPSGGAILDSFTVMYKYTKKAHRFNGRLSYEYRFGFSNFQLRSFRSESLKV